MTRPPQSPRPTGWRWPSPQQTMSLAVFGVGLVLISLYAGGFLMLAWQRDQKNAEVSRAYASICLAEEGRRACMERCAYQPAAAVCGLEVARLVAERAAAAEAEKDDAQ